MNKEIEKHEYNLRQFIDIATRYSIDGLFKSRNPNNNISFIVEYHVENARLFFEVFRNGLKEELSKIENWKAFEIDIKDRFLPMVNTYYEWYDKNKEETKKFEPFNFYEWMFGIIESTEHEINKYFKPQDFPSRKRAELQVKREEREKRRIAQEKEARKNLIDKDGNYWATIEDFKEEAMIEKMNLTQPAYLKYLSAQKILYGKAARYYLHYTDSNLGEEYVKISEFIENEIKVLLNPLSTKQTSKIKAMQNKENYSHKQIAIAHFILKKTITAENAKSILNQYSENKSIAKLLTKRISKASELTKISENRTVDTKHSKDLDAAKRLIRGEKNKTALNDINNVIVAFKNNYDMKY